METRVNRFLREFGLRLRQERIVRRFSVTDMAKKVEISEKTYRRLEKGDPTVAVKNFVAAAFILDIDFAAALAEERQLRKQRVRKSPKIANEEVDF